MGTSMKCLRESELQSQNMLDSHSSQNFQSQDFHTPFLEQPLEEKSYLEKSIEILHGPHNNFKNLLPSISIG